MKKKITLLLVVFAFFNANAQTTIFEDSFESYTNFSIFGVGQWTLTDVDGGIPYSFEDATFPNDNLPKSFQVFNPLFTSPPLQDGNWSARTGNQSMVCFNKGFPEPLVNNDWMISPKMTLGTNNVVKFWAKAGNDFFLAERFTVNISSTSTVVSSFAKISTGDFVTTIVPGLVWREYSFVIPAAYDNLPVYIGIQCVSREQFGLVIDDFNVSGTVSCAAPFLGLSVVNTSALTANLSWTANGSFSSEVKVQIAGSGIPSAANDSGINVSGDTFTTAVLQNNSDYEFWVRSECTSGTLFSSWSGPYFFNTKPAPNCATLNTPSNGNLTVDSTVIIPLTWAAATAGTTATSYDVYFGTNANPTNLIANVNNTFFNIFGTTALTTYYWKIISKNSAGDAVGCTSIFSFTTAPNAFSPYCGPVTYAFDLEPITLVNFAGINKNYPNTIVQPPAITHRIFTNVATVAKGETYPITLKGNTAGASANYFVVFIDWNQNNILDDNGEVYFGNNPLSIEGSTGLDAIQATGNITVPPNAATGTTRMRIKKVFSDGAINIAGITDPCISVSFLVQFGETHDYLVNVQPALATNTFSSANFQSFPNPVKNVLNLQYDKNITNISIINLLGQEVLVEKVNNTNVKIDMFGLTSGVYLVKVTAGNEEKIIKVIKN